MNKSTRETDRQIIATVVEYVANKTQLTRGELREVVAEKAAALNVDASYILEKLEQKFDKNV